MPSFTGEIAESFMEEGKLVQKGDVLFVVKSLDFDLQEEQLADSEENYEEQIAQYEKLIKSIKEDTNYFDAGENRDSLYYSMYENYKAQVAQNEVDTTMYKSYGYTDEQIESELVKAQSKKSELYYTALQTADMARIHEGDKVQIEVNGLSQTIYGNISGSVERIDSNVTTMESGENGSSQVFKIRILPEADYLVSKTGDKVNLSNGMTVEARIIYDKITYSSGNPGIADITVSCGAVKKKLSIKVVKAKDENEEIPVKDIEISDYEEELEVDKTMNLSVTVLPANATDTTVTYKSSDEKIATVNSSGEVKGIGAGKVTITVSAGNISKTVDLTVKYATAKIEMNTIYLVM